MTRREWVEWLVWISGSVAVADDRPAPPVKPNPDTKPAAPALRWFHTVADDFVIDVWHNGTPIPDNCRTLVDEAYGATAEKTVRDVRPGDWLVFHAVNNRFRWSGVKYFGFVGFVAEGDPALISDVESGRWSCCETPGDVAEFLAKPKSAADRPVKAIDVPWDGGAPRMDAAAGGKWTGTPIWGPSARSVWLKLRVPG